MSNTAIKLKIKKLHPSAQIPEKGSQHASGFDLFACIEGDGSITIEKKPVMIGTGISMEIPPGYDIQVRPRSGLSSKGVGVTFGTIDEKTRFRQSAFH